MKIFTHKPKNIAITAFIAFSFSLILLILAITYGLSHIESVNSNVKTIVKEHNAKEHLIVDIYNHARQRVIALFQMALNEDPFVRDELYDEFRNQGAEFIEAREKLLSMLVDDDEEKLLEEQRILTKTAVPLQYEIIEYLNADDFESARQLLKDEGVDAQNVVLRKLQDLVELERQKSLQILSQTNKEYDAVSEFMLWGTTLAATIGFLIAIFTSWRVYRDQRQLDDLNSMLEMKVDERTRELTSSNDELNKTLHQLHETQAQLIENEKMAALGGLVSGVAHEINTPVGVCVTAASTLSEATNEFKKNLQEGKLKKSVLDGYVSKSEDGTKLIISNLMRAADLINNFKQVAVDQAIDDYRKIQLGFYLKEVLSSLYPKWKSSPVEVKLDFDKEIELSTYPGAIAQIITNLITNSLLHGFDSATKPGSIDISFRQDADNLYLEYKDSGRGMSEEVLEKIFNPFFTTRRNAGGTGLGMHIVYNIVTQKLKGKIECHSKPDEGCNIVIHLPLESEELKIAANAF